MAKPVPAPVSAVDAPIPLEELGIHEYEPLVVKNTYDNRRLLTAGGWRFRAYFPKDLEERENRDDWLDLVEVYPANFYQEGLWERRRALLVEPDDANSDYITGQQLLLALDDLPASCRPPTWVLARVREQVGIWQSKLGTDEEFELEEDNGDGTGYRIHMPVRCMWVKSDGARCWLWSNHPKKSPPHCQDHGQIARDPQEHRRLVDAARIKISRAAPAAAEQLEDLMMGAESEPVRLKATTELLDRAGVRGGYEVESNVRVEQVDPAQQVRERLERLAARLSLPAPPPEEAPASEAGSESGAAEPGGGPSTGVVDAEVVEESEPA
jgi:hypothetical protein